MVTHPHFRAPVGGHQQQACERDMIRMTSDCAAGTLLTVHGTAAAKQPQRCLCFMAAPRRSLPHLHCIVRCWDCCLTDPGSMLCDALHAAMAGTLLPSKAYACQISQLPSVLSASLGTLLNTLRHGFTPELDKMCFMQHSKDAHRSNWWMPVLRV